MLVGQVVQRINCRRLEGFVEKILEVKTELESCESCCNTYSLRNNTDMGIKVKNEIKD